MNNRKMLISRIIIWNQLLAVAGRINKQDDYTKYMLSAIAIGMWLLSKVSTYPELGHIQTGKKSVLELNLLIKCRDSKYVIKRLCYGQGVPLSHSVTG